MANKLFDSAAVRAISTNADQAYLRGAFLETVPNRLKDLLNLDSEPEHRFLKEWVDPLHPLIRKLKRMPKRDMRPITYTGQKITTLSYEVYGNTSMWWIPLYVSGYCHPHEVPPGAILYFPSMQRLQELFDVTPKTRRGSIVRT